TFPVVTIILTSISQILFVVFVPFTQALIAPIVARQIYASAIRWSTIRAGRNLPLFQYSRLAQSD
ncbi:MAG TPA: hypothetical protein DEW32_01785, partial [Dehalococcoidia bacterium]|nr:hypothetical protein [Dehalococcoidia bacterium]